MNTDVIDKYYGTCSTLVQFLSISTFEILFSALVTKYDFYCMCEPYRVHSDDLFSERIKYAAYSLSAF